MNLLAIVVSYLALGWCWLAVEYRAAKWEQRTRARMTPFHIGATWLLWPLQIAIALVIAAITLCVASAQRIGGGSTP